MLESFKKETFTAPLLVLSICLFMALSNFAVSFVEFESRQDLLLTYAVMELLVFVLPAVFYVKCKKRGYAADMQMISFGFSQLPLILLMFFVLSLGGILFSLVYTYFGISFDSSAKIWQDALSLSKGDFFENEKTMVYISLVLAVVPAFAEEFVFRGVLLKEYSRYGMVPAVL
ncbi:MAG: hypothetical protein IJY89_04745, partial [Clostridia bacterium]|nr:hypothetical protein [Clostridia bacterium]